MCNVVAYYRVSTEGQGRSGLGLEAQREAVRQLCDQRDWKVISEFTEIESGKNAKRPELTEALHRAKVTGATLVVAKLDRLSRSVAFLSSLQEAGAKFVAADMPEANQFTVHIMAAVAEAERQAISIRTKDALRAAKAAGKRLGNPNGARALRRAGKGNKAAINAVTDNADRFAEDLIPIIRDIQHGGISALGGIAKELNNRHIQTRRGGRWHASSVSNLLARIADRVAV